MQTRAKEIKLKVSRKKVIFEWERRNGSIVDAEPRIAGEELSRDIYSVLRSQETCCAAIGGVPGEW